MKKTGIFFYLCAFIIIESCNKDASQKSNNNSIEGIWELRQTSAQSGVKNYEWGNNNMFYFTSNGFQKYSPGEITDSGTYRLIHDTSASENVCLVLTKGEYETRIEFNNVELPKQFIQISNDSLYFLSGCFANDGGTAAIYVRKTYIY